MSAHSVVSPSPFLYLPPEAGKVCWRSSRWVSGMLICRPWRQSARFPSSPLPQPSSHLEGRKAVLLRPREAVAHDPVGSNEEQHCLLQAPSTSSILLPKGKGTIEPLKPTFTLPLFPGEPGLENGSVIHWRERGWRQRRTPSAKTKLVRLTKRIGSLQRPNSAKTKWAWRGVGTGSGT